MATVNKLPQCLFRQIITSICCVCLAISTHATESLDFVKHENEPAWAHNCRAQITGGKASDVIRALQSQRKRTIPGTDTIFEIIWGRACLAAQCSELAEKGLAGFMVPQGNYNPEKSEVYLVATYVLLNRNRFTEAAKLADWISVNDEGVALVLGTEAYSKALIGTRDYAAAVESADFSLKYAREKLYNGEKAYDELFRLLEASLAAARRALDIGMYGLDYVLFRDAEQLRRQQRSYTKALTGYTDVIERFPLSIYADASNVYQAICLVKGRQIPKAEAILRKYIETHSNGFYVGEAMLQLAQIELDINMQPGDATEWSKRLDDWIALARNRRTPVAGFKLNPKTTEKILPPKEKLTNPDAFRNQRKKEIEPGQLINQVTCDWYLDDLEAECMKMRGFLSFVAGRKEEARLYFSRLQKLEPELKAGSTEKNPNDFTRLSWGLDHGYLYAYPQELELFKDRQRLAILIADFAYVTERFDECLETHKRLINGELGPIPSDRMEYPRFAIACATYWISGREDACKALLPFLEPAKMTWTRQRALLSFANMGLASKDKTLREMAERALETLVSTTPPTDWVLQGMLLKAQRLVAAGNKSEGISILKSIGNFSKEWKELSDYLIAENQTTKESP